MQHQLEQQALQHARSAPGVVVRSPLIIAPANRAALATAPAAPSQRTFFAVAPAPIVAADPASA
jgi:hypothetical protein